MAARATGEFAHRRDPRTRSCAKRAARRRAAAWFAVFVLAGCGSDFIATPIARSREPVADSPVVAPRPSATVAAATPPATGPSARVAGPASATPSPSAPRGASGDEPASAAGRLATLDSYRFAIRLSGASAPFAGSELSGDLSAHGTVVERPQAAMEVVLDLLSGQAAPGLSYVIVGNRSWLRAGSLYIPLASDQAATAQALAALRPENLFLASYGQYLGLLAPAGFEDRNGVASHHFVGSEAARAGAARQAGSDPNDWAIDVWIARDGGYLVAARMTGLVLSAGQSTRLEVVIDISGLNDPANVVALPPG